VSLVTARALAIGYGTAIVASLPELVIETGERLAITGANGSGKTTLLKTLAGLIPPIAGELSAPAPGRGGAVYVHPAPFLFAGTGGANVLLGAHGDHDAARRALDAMAAGGFSRADVRALSHGQRQRIAIAGDLAAAPVLLLVDEPETGLDTEGLEAWQRVVRERQDIAIVSATHRGGLETTYEGPGRTRRVAL
jgi:energy-coupling factor transporter ATP-binding protein EcfA2